MDSTLSFEEKPCTIQQLRVFCAENGLDEASHGFSICAGSAAKIALESVKKGAYLVSELKGAPPRRAIAYYGFSEVQATDSFLKKLFEHYGAVVPALRALYGEEEAKPEPKPANEKATSAYRYRIEKSPSGSWLVVREEGQESITVYYGKSEEQAKMVYDREVYGIVESGKASDATDACTWYPQNAPPVGKRAPYSTPPNRVSAFRTVQELRQYYSGKLRRLEELGFVIYDLTAPDRRTKRKIRDSFSSSSTDSKDNGIVKQEKCVSVFQAGQQLYCGTDEAAAVAWFETVLETAGFLDKNAIGKASSQISCSIVLVALIACLPLGLILLVVKIILDMRNR